MASTSRGGTLAKRIRRPRRSTSATSTGRSSSSFDLAEDPHEAEEPCSVARASGSG